MKRFTIYARQPIALPQIRGKVSVLSFGKGCLWGSLHPRDPLSKDPLQCPFGVKGWKQGENQQHCILSSVCMDANAFCSPTEGDGWLSVKEKKMTTPLPDDTWTQVFANQRNSRDERQPLRSPYGALLQVEQASQQQNALYGYSKLLSGRECSYAFLCRDATETLNSGMGERPTENSKLGRTRGMPEMKRAASSMGKLHQMPLPLE